METEAAEAADATDALDELLVRARGLIDTALSVHHDESRRQDLSPAAAGSAIRAMCASAGENVRCVVFTREFVEELLTIADRSPERARLEILCDAQLARTSVARQLSELPNAEARVAPRDLPEIVLGKGFPALARTGSTAGMLMFAAYPGMSEVLSQFFEVAWQASSSVAEFHAYAQVHDCDQTKLVLISLANGHKDDVAARQLGVSVRTYRRYVADLARVLGVRSRFGIGMRAVELGLISKDDMT